MNGSSPAGSSVCNDVLVGSSDWHLYSIKRKRRSEAREYRENKSKSYL